jgi:DNA-binding MarR family transcriptional regulator
VGVDDALFQRLIAAYGKAVGVLDPVRIKFYTERGLTMPQMRVLFMLAERPGASAGDLAEELNVAPPTISGMTDRLDKQGLIVRGVDPNDRRVVRLFLSEEGTRLTTEVADMSKAALRNVFERMPEEKLELLTGLLEELTQHGPLTFWSKEVAPSQR